MSTALTLSQLTDLALGSPEVGAVNFNVLHTLMHAILSKLNLDQEKAEISKMDKEFLSGKKPEDTDLDGFSDKDSAITNMTGTTDRTDRPNTRDQSAIPYKRAPYHELENKVHKMQEQIDRFNSLPSNEELMKMISHGDGERQRPVSDMWQAMQIKNKVDANENGISKLMSLVEDLMNDVGKLKDENGELKKQLENAKNMDDMLKRLNDLEALANQLKDQQNAMGDQLDSMPDDFNDFVTWSGLEDALLGMREELQSKESIVVEMAQQTTPHTSRPASRRSSTPGPSVDLLDMLERIGFLTERHDKLEDRVDKIEDELRNKADKNDLDGLGGVPDDLIERLDKLHEEIEELKKTREKDSDALSRLHQALYNLQHELERVSKQCQHLIDENGNRIKDIDSLFTTTKDLDADKADKEWVQNRMDMKADKKQLESKVNKSLFDETCEELNKMISDVLAKLKECEDEWKSALQQMTVDLDGKLDRLEFSPIKEEIERQLRALMRKINTLNVHNDMDDDAAGIRKQLVQRFHCISCDRPVDMMPQGPIPSIPNTQGMPSSRSARPYTTYELDQIRQLAKSNSDGLPYLPLNHAPMQGMSPEMTELYNNRACGGSHTMTFPHRRTTRSSHINNLFQDEEVQQPTKEELDVMGADGHIYKGRVDKLPNLSPSQVKSSPKLGRRAMTDMSSEPAPPMSPRPSSARTPRATTQTPPGRMSQSNMRDGQPAGSEPFMEQPQPGQQVSDRRSQQSMHQGGSRAGSRQASNTYPDTAAANAGSDPHVSPPSAPPPTDDGEAAQ